eukprot:6205742-Pleurochrysis_carterae.AAC.1
MLAPARGTALRASWLRALWPFRAVRFVCVALPFAPRLVLAFCCVAEREGAHGIESARSCALRHDGRVQCQARCGRVVAPVAMNRMRDCTLSSW